MTPSSLLCLRNLTKIYGSDENVVRALDRINLDVMHRQFVAITGPSGSGKSTLLHCAAGLDAASGGQVYLNGDELTSMNDDALTLTRRDRIGFIFQAFNLLPTMTAEENVLLPLRLGKRRVDSSWFDAVVGMLGIGDRLEHYPVELSGGQQQRVAVARALMTKPELIFADEPTGALDQSSSDILMRFLRRSSDELGQTIVMVTHDSAAARWADRIVELRDGRVASDTMHTSGVV